MINQNKHTKNQNKHTVELSLAPSRHCNPRGNGGHSMHAYEKKCPRKGEWTCALLESGERVCPLRGFRSHLCMRQAPEHQDCVLWQLSIHLLNLSVATQVVGMQALYIGRHILLPQVDHLQGPRITAGNGRRRGLPLSCR